MPIGRFYEAILNTPSGVPEVKPEEPATSVKKAGEASPEAEASQQPAKRGRKPKAKADPAATATAGTAPTASPAASPKDTAKEVAAKASSLASANTTPSPPSVRHSAFPPSLPRLTQLTHTP